MGIVILVIFITSALVGVAADCIGVNNLWKKAIKENRKMFR